jgi:hypothetical protein
MNVDHRQLEIEINFLKNRLFNAEQDLIRLAAKPKEFSHGLTVGDYVVAKELEQGELRSIFHRKNGCEMAIIEKDGHLHVARLSLLRKSITR